MCLCVTIAVLHLTSESSGEGRQYVDQVQSSYYFVAGRHHPIRWFEVQGGWTVGVVLLLFFVFFKVLLGQGVISQIEPWHLL